MKKFFVIAALLSCSFIKAQAQFTIGLKAGLNAANITGKMGTTPEFDRDRKISFHAGIVSNFEASDRLSVQPEALFSLKGYKVEDTQTNNNETTKTDINSRLYYLDIPVLVRLHSGQFYLEAGPQASFLLKQDTDSHVVKTRERLLGGEEEIENTRTSPTYDFKSTDMGYAVGLGFTSPSKAASFGFRYSQSLGTALKDTKTDAKNSLVQIYISSNLPVLGGK